MSKIGVCSKCGKEGVWRPYINAGHRGVTLDHYCPVAYRDRKAKKDAARQVELETILKTGELPSAMSVYFVLMPLGIHQTDWADDFEPTQQELERDAAVTKVHNFYRENILSYIKEKNKKPSKATVKRIADEANKLWLKEVA